MAVVVDVGVGGGGGSALQMLFLLFHLHPRLSPAALHLARFVMAAHPAGAGAGVGGGPCPACVVRGSIVDVDDVWRL